jgi:glycosyltransferase involved in cell wall biosynthesis
MHQDKPSFLLVCDEWSPTRGGISTFNRDLATALAAAGHRTACLVRVASRQERSDAHARGVTLITAEETPAGPVLWLCSPAVVRFAPDVVIGHDRVSGWFAWAYARRHLVAKLVHVVHTAPSEIERYKDTQHATERTEAREQFMRKMAAEADVIAAVGPRLARNTRAVVDDGYGTTQVEQLDPGLTTGLITRRRPLPPKLTALLLGRADEVRLKGLDIAAKAVAEAGLPSLGLRVRGAPRRDCDALAAELMELSGLAPELIDVRPFTDDADQIAVDLRHAALCVMPSRVEGFGLVALEAIEAGTPVLVSRKSGVAELLTERLGRSAMPMIVDGDEPAVWANAIRHVLTDLHAAFDYAHDIAVRLAGELRWDHVVNQLVTRVGQASAAVR